MFYKALLDLGSSHHFDPVTHHSLFDLCYSFILVFLLILKHTKKKKNAPTSGPLHLLYLLFFHSTSTVILQGAYNLFFHYP